MVGVDKSTPVLCVVIHIYIYNITTLECWYTLINLPQLT
jgi:hypothetical protein